MNNSIIEVYHITHIAYEKGTIVRANDFDGETYYHQNLSAAQKEIDDYLSEQKPEDEPSVYPVFILLKALISAYISETRK